MELIVWFNNLPDPIHRHSAGDQAGGSGGGYQLGRPTVQSVASLRLHNPDGNDV